MYLAEINLQFIPLSIFDKLWFYRSGRDLDNTVSSKLDDLAKKKRCKLANRRNDTVEKSYHHFI